MANKVEFIAGTGINIEANNANKTIKISSTGGSGGGGGGSGNISSLSKEEIKMLKLLLGEPTIIDQSGTYTIPKTGKYKMKLCGGGASGALGIGATSNGYNFSGGTGGNSGYLRTEVLTLTKDTVLQIVIGAGGAFSYPNANSGGLTKVTINSIVYDAAGGKPNDKKGAFGDSSGSQGFFQLAIDIPYDGEKGSLLGGFGHWQMKNSNASAKSMREYAQNIYSGAFWQDFSNYPYDGWGGGGAGGPIPGNIKAGKGTAYNAATGYGAGGGGGGPSSTTSSATDKHPGNGAPGAVSLEFIE